MKVVRVLLKSRPFMAVSLASMLFLAAQMFGQGYNAYLFDHYFNRPGLTMLPTVFQYLPVAVVMFFATRVGNKFGRREVCSYGVLVAAAFYILLFVLALLYTYCRPAAIRDALSADRGAGTYHSILSRRRFFIGLFAVGAIVLHLSAGALVDHLAEHQRNRVQVLLGLRDDPNGVGYNVIQAKIAIGSGGLEGKGFLNGTQTKLKYVPEQETDFIFCTVGEEQGFIGSAAVLLLFLALLLRLLHVAERQPYAFGRVYGYCVFSVFFFHVLINVGMVLGLMPVIGIPLPFFSYGGSSLWGFTLLLFIFLRIDAGRSRLKR